MKKIIITISIIVASITTAVLLIVLWPNNTEELKVKNYNNTVLDLGTYEVREFKRERESNLNDTIYFVVEDENKFYNDLIKKCEHYNSDLELDFKDYYAYGFYVFNECIFHYEIVNKKVTITSNYLLYSDITENGIYIEYDSYYVPGVFDNTSYLHQGSFDDGEDYVVASYSFKYNDFKKIISYLPEKLWEIKGESLLLKGSRFDDDDNIEYSDFIVEVFEKDGYMCMSMYKNGQND